MRSVFHLAYNVRDLDETCRFYGGVLGCQERAGARRPGSISMSSSTQSRFTWASRSPWPAPDASAGISGRCRIWVTPWNLRTGHPSGIFCRCPPSAVLRQIEGLHERRMPGSA
ncbi:VOC family protein [Methylobacterium phyllostachyos]|uniref:VOC family protein n=1 Tax=Methylobacterium phyllostachyos TaxID=582672 RepID=UPI0031390FB4